MKIVVANLDRRQDRWYTCLGALIALQYPAKHVRRFSAHDGKPYLQKHYGDVDAAFTAARADAIAQFPESTFVSKNNCGLFYYCWAWTWYDIMTRIARGDYGDLVLLLVDDWVPRYTRGQLEKSVEILNGVHKIKCAQLEANDQIPSGFSDDEPLPVPAERISGTEFHRGIYKSGDIANILSPEGASAILDVADSRPNLCVPNWVFYLAARRVPNLDGYYTGHIGLHLANPHVDAFQDGRYSY